MPVAAAKPRHHDALATERTRAVPRHAHTSRRTSGARVETQAAPDWQSVEPLLDHFNGEDEQARATRKARRKARRAHRPLHVSWPAGIAAALLLSHLVVLLWLHGCALSARNRDAQLGAQIRQARSEIERTQKKIAALDSSPRIIEWARKRGWRAAVQADFDDVTKPAVVHWNVPPSGSDAKPLDQSASTPSVQIEAQEEREIR